MVGLSQTGYTSYEGDGPRSPISHILAIIHTLHFVMRLEHKIKLFLPDARRGACVVRGGEQKEEGSLV